MPIEHTALYRYRLPLREPLTLKGVPYTHREGLLLQLTDDQGHTGWGEAAPLPSFSRESLAESIATLHDFLVQPVTAPSASLAPAAYFAVQGALYNLRAASEGTDVARLLCDSPEDTVYINALLLGSREAILEKTQEAVLQGYRAVKLKVGRATPLEDAALATEVKTILGEKIALRLDANRAWTLAAALDFAEALGEVPLEYCEEPLRDPGALPAFFESTGMAYALDETLAQGPACVSAQVFQNAAALIWKPTLVPARDPAHLRARFGLTDTPVILSASFESGVGTALLAQYAAASGTAPAGLDPYTWLAQDLLETPLPLATHSIPRAEIAAKPLLSSTLIERCPEIR